MKKFKLYKNNELVKTILKAKGYYKTYNRKLDNSATATFFGAIFIKLLKEDFDNPYINFIQAGSAIIIWGGFISYIYDKKNVSKNKEKLSKLQEELDKQGIKVDFIFDGNQVAEFTNEGIDYINIAIDKTHDIECFQDGKVEYVDSDENRKDITDEVYKCILSKRKYDRYTKKKNKNKVGD